MNKWVLIIWSGKNFVISWNQFTWWNIWTNKQNWTNTTNYWWNSYTEIDNTKNLLSEMLKKSTIILWQKNINTINYILNKKLYSKLKNKSAKDKIKKYSSMINKIDKIKFKFKNNKIIYALLNYLYASFKLKMLDI